VRIKLSKETILRLFCYCREGERSVHRALSANWSDLRAYYSETKRTEIKQLIKKLRQVAGQPVADGLSLTRNEAGKIVSAPGIIRYYLGRWLVQHKKAWTFPLLAIQFMALTLHSLVRFVEEEIKPDTGSLISLRMDLCVCQSLIEGRCHGLAEIERAKWIEHFQMTEWLPKVTLTDILGDHSEWARPAKKTA
jgi:hypothetical protein